MNLERLSEVTAHLKLEPRRSLAEDTCQVFKPLATWDSVQIEGNLRTLMMII